MASTFSPILRIELIGTGDQSGTWGNTTNVNLGTLIEEAIAGTSTIDVSSGNVTLSNFNGASDQARCMALRTTGTPGVSRNLIAPAVSKLYIIANGSNAAVVIKTSVSVGISVPSGEVFLVYYDTTSADFRLVGRAAASTNTANTLVLRDSSGNFAAGTITATFVGNISGGTGAFTTLSSTGNTTIGDASADTLTVNATPTFNVAIPVTSGGTGVTTSTGSGSNVLSTSPTLVTPVLGTPTSGTLTNCTGLPIATGVSGLGTGVATFLATPSSANLASAVTDETGTGSLVFATSPTISSPTLVTPVLGTPTSGTLTNCTGLPISGGTTGTLPVLRGGTGVTTSTGSGDVVLNTSPALAGTPTAPTAAVTTDNTQIATTAFVRDIVPAGVIVMWSGSIASIPSGWYLCNGSNGTPDLRNRFVVGAFQDNAGVANTTITGSNSLTGGSKDAIVVSHTHTATVTDPGHSHSTTPSTQFLRATSGSNGSNSGSNWRNDTLVVNSATTGITVSNSTEGSSGTNANLVPYYALAYIMKA